MPRNINAAVITELAKDSFHLAHLLYMDLGTGIWFTDNAFSISYGANTYLAQDNLLSISDPQETRDLRVGTVNITMSGVDQSFISIFLQQEYINRKVTVQKVLLDSNGLVIGMPIVAFDGQITQYEISETNRESQVTINVASHWADFEKKAGRFTNSNSQQYHFSGDLGMDYASSTIRDLKWGRK